MKAPVLSGGPDAPEEQPGRPRKAPARACVRHRTPVRRDVERPVEPPRRGELEIIHVRRHPLDGPRAHCHTAADHGTAHVSSRPFVSLRAAAAARADTPDAARRTRRATLRLSALCQPFPSGSCSAARSPVMGSSQQVCSTEPVPARAAGADRDGACSGGPVDPYRGGPTSSGALSGPAPRPAHGAAPGRDRWTEVAPDSHRDRRSALHEALPHIRKEISQ